MSSTVAAAIATLAFPWAFASGAPTGAAPASSIQNRVLAASPGDVMTLTVGDEAHAFTVSREGLRGEGIELRAFPGHLRGHVGRESVDMSLASPRITGLIGDREISLDMLPARQGLRVAGRFGAREVALTARPEQIDGAIGPCLYRMRLSNGTYAGDVACGGEPVHVVLDVPAALVARPDVELAAILVALLAR
jgi:hypothetical protein